MIVAATILQFTAAMLAFGRAVMLSWLRRRGTPIWTREPWFLAAVLLADVVNDWGNRAINAALPAPGGPPLEGAARAAAHVGLALYAAWLCGGLAYVGWLGRWRMGAVGVGGAVAFWLVFVGAIVFKYPEIRGEAALRMLGALHMGVFALQVPCFLTFVVSRGDRLGTERICALWLAFLGLAAGIGPLRPWAEGPIDRIAAESTIAAAMVALYSSIVVTIVVGGVPWVNSWWRGRSGSWRLPRS